MSLKERMNFEKEPLYIMDGNAFIFRGFYANPHMSRSDSFPTGAMHIVGRTLFKILREEKPENFIFVLDGQGPHFRHEIFADYKANRPPAPEELVVQFEPIKRMVKSLGIHVEISNNCEADDYIASIAKRFSEERPVVIIGMDKDLRQCLNPQVIMWDPASKEEKILTDELFREETGLEPSQWPDVQALIGDTSDNIPGVRGIGEKTAIKIFIDNKHLEDVRDNFDNLSAPIKKKLEGNLEAMFVYRKLTTLRTDCCLDMPLETFALKASVNSQAFFQEFQLNALKKEYSELVKKNILFTQDDPHSATPQKETEDIKAQESQKNDTLFFISSVADLPDSTGQIVAFIPDQEGVYINLMSIPKGLRSLPYFNAKPTKSVQKNTLAPKKTKTSKKQAQQSLSLFDLLEDNSAKVVSSKQELSKENLQLEEKARLEEKGQESTQKEKNSSNPALLSWKNSQDFYYNGALEDLAAYIQKASQIIVFDAKTIFHQYPNFANKFNMFSALFDLSIGAWLLSPDEKDFSPMTLYNRFASQADLSPRHPAYIALNMYEDMVNSLENRSLLKLMYELEMPLMPALYAMECKGINVDSRALKEFLEEVQNELEHLTERIYQAAGGPFNIRSAQQLGQVLFQKLELQVGKSSKTKGGQLSTSQEVLEDLAGKHPVIEALQEYRKLEKLRSTYLEPLPRQMADDGRIHTTFNQFATATGRLSSSNPNVQNIPIRGELGLRMRTCFTAKKGHVLISADYSQVELRVLAHCSGDKTLCNAFLNGEDIHSRTAAMLYDVAIADVTSDMRRHAKTINFGLLYGMGPRKLSKDLHITLTEAKDFIARYFERFHSIKAFYDEVEDHARKHAFVTTLAGRQRLLTDINSENTQARALAERQSVNTLIQGSAADIIKLAMLAVEKDQALREWSAELILQVHDELILEVPEEFAEKAGKRVAELMMNIELNNKKLDVPLLVDYGIGKNWGLAH